MNPFFHFTLFMVFILGLVFISIKNAFYFIKGKVDPAREQKLRYQLAQQQLDDFKEEQRHGKAINRIIEDE